MLLIVAGFFFTLLTFEPFGLGWKGWLYAIGIAIVTPFLIEKLLDDGKMEGFLRVLTGVAAVAGLASLMVLAVIRGDLLAQEVQAQAPALVIDNAQSTPATENTFYNSTLILLRIATVLVAFTMELGAGLALREAWNAGSDSEDWTELKTRLVNVRQRMAEIVEEVTHKSNEPGIFAERLWRDFYRSMLAHTARSAINKLPILLLGLALLPPPRASAERLNLVIAVDLTNPSPSRIRMEKLSSRRTSKE